MTPEQIEREFQLFRTIIPASSADTQRRRTAYFYRRQAIEWGRMARQWWPGGDMPSLCRRLATSYVATYRQMKTNKRTV
jgi:hypothetical protein